MPGGPAAPVLPSTFVAALAAAKEHQRDDDDGNGFDFDEYGSDDAEAEQYAECFREARGEAAPRRRRRVVGPADAGDGIDVED